MKLLGIGPTLRRWRETVLGVSLSEFAASVGSDKGSISKYENDQLHVTLEKLDEWQSKLDDSRYSSVHIITEYLSNRYPKFKEFVQNANPGE